MNALKQGEIRQILPQGLVVAGARGEHHLGPVLQAVWRAADGQTPVAGLVAAARGVDATADEALVWQALDSLADAGLLKARLAPPAAVVDRRALFLRVAAAAAAVVVAVAPGRGRADDSGRKQEQSEKAAPDDTGRKQEQSEKAIPARESDVKAKEQQGKLAPRRESAKKVRVEEEDRKKPAREQANKAGAEAVRTEQRVKDSELAALAQEEAAKGL